VSWFFIDATHSDEYALGLSGRGSQIVKELLVEDGINRDPIYALDYGKTGANPLFTSTYDRLSRNFNNYVPIAVVLK
jgi:outer membrane protein OmpA-like peptidoglycan-associated protein